MSKHVQALYTKPNVTKTEELIMKVTNYAWSEMTLVEQQELREQAAAELARLQAIEQAAREALDSFMVTDVWDDEAGTPAREEAVGDMTRDQKLEALAAALEAKP